MDDCVEVRGVKVKPAYAGPGIELHYEEEATGIKRRRPVQACLGRDGCCFFLFGGCGPRNRQSVNGGKISGLKCRGWLREESLLPGRHGVKCTAMQVECI